MQCFPFISINHFPILDSRSNINANSQTRSVLPPNSIFFSQQLEISEIILNCAERFQNLLYFPRF